MLAHIVDMIIFSPISIGRQKGFVFVGFGKPETTLTSISATTVALRYVGQAAATMSYQQRPCFVFKLLLSRLGAQHSSDCKEPSDPSECHVWPWVRILWHGCSDLSPLMQCLYSSQWPAPNTLRKSRFLNPKQAAHSTPATSLH